MISAAKAKSLFLVVIQDSNQGAFFTTQEVPRGSLDYDRLLEMGKHDFEIVSPIDECDPITVNRTSGSTGTPKEALGPVTVRSILEFDQYGHVSIKDRDGVHNVVMEGVDVKDPMTMRSVLVDGKTVGEVTE
ncbi:hypothetical protein RHMOL_Rhmol10G0289200 [Rhododendron molle]|uniref:Uncharacterized protein n=1 Tax=Rhododendron molle TaxID=49168 RepID=A0ACC0M8M3_RHOML|nr:hypothetical protein RHMOL_Rhmol10G0289200 [Rhododendron molle]